MVWVDFKVCALSECNIFAKKDVALKVVSTEQLTGYSMRDTTK